MSKEVKWAGVGAILSPLLIAFLVGVTGLFGTWASKVPALESTIKLEFAHNKSSMEKLTEAQTTTNFALKAHAENDTKMIKILSETVLGHDFMIKQIVEEQERNR